MHIVAYESYMCLLADNTQPIGKDRANGCRAGPLLYVSLGTLALGGRYDVRAEACVDSFCIIKLHCTPAEGPETKYVRSINNQRCGTTQQPNGDELKHLCIPHFCDQLICVA